RLMLSWHQVVVGDTSESTQRRNFFRYEISFSKLQSTVGASGGVDRSRRSGAWNSDQARLVDSAFPSQSLTPGHSANGCARAATFGTSPKILARFSSRWNSVDRPG